MTKDDILCNGGAIDDLGFGCRGGHGAKTVDGRGEGAISQSLQES